jgi:periplasmic protein TonB
MFEDSLIESTHHIAIANRRGWTTLFSTSIQIFLLAFLVVLPLLRTNTISSRHLGIDVIAPYISQPVSTGNNPSSGAVDSGMVTPLIPSDEYHGVPHGPVTTPDPPGPASPDLCPGCGGSPLGVLHAFGPAPAPMPILLKPKPLVISTLRPGQIIRRVEPAYPYLAKVARIQGPVVLHALISREGTIEQLQVLTGNPLLNKAALDAVQQWRFRPYILNGQAIEVETEVTVNFILGGG